MTRRAALAAAVLTVVVASLPSLLVPGSVRAADAPAARGAAYLTTTQGADGSVPAGWRPDQVAESVVALVAGGGQPQSVERAVGFLERNGGAGASSGPYAGRIVAGLVAAGRDPRQFAGIDFVARTESFHDPVSGTYGGNLYGDALAMLGLLSAGRTLPDSAVNRIRLNQCRDGGWAHQAGCAGQPDTDTTSMAVAVLAATVGTATSEVRAGRSWLLANQHTSGCWGHAVGSPDNANSCGLAISAVYALRERPDSEPWTLGGRDAIAALRDLQLDSGAFQYRKDVAGANDYATQQAVPALAGWPYPVRGSTSTSTSTTARTTTTTVPHAHDDEYAPAAGSAPPPAGVDTTDVTSGRTPRQAPRPAPGVTVVPGGTASTGKGGSGPGAASAKAGGGASAPTPSTAGGGVAAATETELGLRSGPISRARDGEGGGDAGISPLGPVIELLTLVVLIVTFRWRRRMRARTAKPGE